MAALSTVARDLSIGSGDISGFVSGVKQRACAGGLFSYTTAKNFRRANTINNYDSGMVGRYRYSSFWNGDIDDTTKAKVPYGVGNGYGHSYLYRDFIGDGYTTDSTGMNSDLRFITRDDFTDFEFLLREEALSRNYDETYNEDRHETSDKFQVEDYEAKALGYNSEIANDYIPKMFRGDQYVVGNTLMLGTRHAILEEYGKRFRALANSLQQIVKQGIDREFSYDTYKRTEVDKNHPFDRLSEVTDGPRNRIFYGLDSLYITAAKQLLEYDKMAKGSHGENPFVSLYAHSKDQYNEELSYGEAVELPENFIEDVATKKNKWKIANDGLLLFSNKYRNKYTSIIEGMRYPSEFFTWENSYGVDYSQLNGLERYSIEDKRNTFTGATIDTKFTKGGNTVSRNGNLTYSYYQEGGVTDVNNKGDITDDSAVMIGKTFGREKGLLSRTNDLFKAAKVNTLINRFHTNAVSNDDELITSFTENFGMSRGRNLLTKDAEETGIGDDSTGYENPYCRVWTAHHQYSKLRDRIRPFYNESGATSIEKLQAKYGVLRPNNGAKRLSKYTSLGLDGFPVITPSHEKRDVRNCMFSIENLAWRDNNNDLSPEQIGPNQGRIMWFPPYNLKFTENVNTQWQGNQFIGRGEQIYTYVNTERTGTLSFTILIDHPSILNLWRGTSDDVADKEKKQNDILRYFAGCDDLSSEIENVEDVKDTQAPLDEDPNIDPVPIPENKYIAYVMFFSNDFTGKDYFKNMAESISAVSQYEVSCDGSIFSGRDETYKNEKIDNQNKSLYKLNLDPSYSGCVHSDALVKQIKDTLLSEYGDNIEIRYLTGENGLEHLEKEITGDKIFGENANTVQIKQIDVRGFASSHGYPTNNAELCKRRMTFAKNVVKYRCSAINDDMFKELNGQVIQMHDADPNHRDINTVEAKIARSAFAVFNIEWKNNNVASALVDGQGVSEGGIYKSTPKDNGNEVTYGVARSNNIPEPTVIVNRENILQSNIPAIHTGIVDPNGIISPNGGTIYPNTNPLANVKSEVKPEVDRNAEELAANSVTATTGSTTNDVSNAPINTPNSKTEKRELVQRNTINNVEGYTADNEYLYFASVRGNKLLFENIVDKVRFFDPVFHSITPEGFNARLTFLHQCTRQGPTVSVSSANAKSADYLKYAGNLSFGRAPYCILRIGDFFNTKICIDSMSIDYDNGGGVQWDMNPEGVGIQPMYANVNINFKFIGGQDIGGVIERLQNAVSYNYYANASVYDRHANYKDNVD